jgi:hypothetical protein
MVSSYELIIQYNIKETVIANYFYGRTLLYSNSAFPTKALLSNSSADSLSFQAACSLALANYLKDSEEPDRYSTFTYVMYISRIYFYEIYFYSSTTALYFYTEHTRCLDVCTTPQSDTVTLRPALSDTEMIRPMSCCGLATQLQQYD